MYYVLRTLPTDFRGPGCPVLVDTSITSQCLFFSSSLFRPQHTHFVLFSPIAFLSHMFMCVVKRRKSFERTNRRNSLFSRAISPSSASALVCLPSSEPVMVPCILECGTSRRSRVTGNKPIGAFYWIGKNEVLLPGRDSMDANGLMVLVPFRWESNPQSFDDCRIDSFKAGQLLSR